MTRVVFDTTTSILYGTIQLIKYRISRRHVKYVITNKNSLLFTLHFHTSSHHDYHHQERDQEAERRTGNQATRNFLSIQTKNYVLASSIH